MDLSLLTGVAIAPLLVAQGALVLARTPVLPEAEGARAGIEGQGPPLSVLVVGDSSAAGVGVRTQSEALAGCLVKALAVHHTVRWRLVAKSGATTRGALARMSAEPVDHFDIAVLALGVNDVIRGRSVSTWLRETESLRALLRQRFGVVQIVISGLPPVGLFPALPQPLRWVLGQRAARFDARLRLALQGLPYEHHVPLTFSTDPTRMARDGFHPGPTVYAEWAGLVAREIRGRTP